MNTFPNSLHHTAQPSHYAKDAKHYDALNEHNTIFINKLLEKILKQHRVKTVLDLSCGTGSQVFWLAKSNFDIIGVDINDEMLTVAKEKARKQGADLTFMKGDMRTTQVGNFDAVITIFNAIGHLTIPDFEKTIQNVYKNLKKGGLYLFDIFNLDYLLAGDNITSFTIDLQERTPEEKIRKIQYSTIDNSGILTSHTISLIQQNNNQPTLNETSQTLQVYSTAQLQNMLTKYGFTVLDQREVNDLQFKPNTDARILTIAQK